MPDIRMCPDVECPVARGCRRSKMSGTKPDGFFDAKTGDFCDYQSYFVDSPRTLATFGEVQCRYYWPIRSTK